jgi:hypothetical protein
MMKIIGAYRSNAISVASKIQFMQMIWTQTNHVRSQDRRPVSKETGRFCFCVQRRGHLQQSHGRAGELITFLTDFSPHLAAAALPFLAFHPLRAL